MSPSNGDGGGSRSIPAGGAGLRAGADDGGALSLLSAGRQPGGAAQGGGAGRQVHPTDATHNDIRQGFVYERVPHITLKSIANNAEIDEIWEKWQQTLEPLRASLNAALAKSWEEWEIPREAGASWSEAALADHSGWWQARIARQHEIDAAIAQAADVEPLYDRPTPMSTITTKPMPGPNGGASRRTRRPARSKS